MLKIRKRKTKDPCPRCFLHRTLCICDVIPSLNLRTRVTLIVHVKELKRTTNTGRLVVQSLINSEMCIRGKRGEPLDLSGVLNSDYQPYLLYPSDDAVELDVMASSKIDKPVQLLVPDGNWRQAGKVHGRHPELQAIPRVKVSRKNWTNRHLRKEHFVDGMSTLEAVAIALAVLEGHDVDAALMALYQAKLTATRIGRGQERQS